MLVQYDYLVEDLLKSLGIPYVREDRKVNKAFRHIGHSHDRSYTLKIISVL